MKKIRKLLEAALVITVIFTLISMTSMAVVTNNNSIKNEKKSVELEGLAKRTKNVEKTEINRNIANLEGNIIISPGEGDYTHPQITKDGNGNIVVAMTQELNFLDNRIAWSYSVDNGVNWDAIEWTEEALDVYHDIAMIDCQFYTGLLGTYNDIEEGFESFYTIPDITDLDTWEFWYWTNGAIDLEYNVISDFGYLEGQYHDMDGPVYMTTQHLIYESYDIPQCPNSMIIGFDDTGIVGGESTFDGQGGPHGENPFATAPAVDPDMSNEFMKSHYTWQFNDPEGPAKIVWKKIIPIDGDTDSTDLEFTPYQQYVGEGEHPTIAHYENNVAILFMNEGNILCTYSSDDGDSWSEPVSLGPGSFPDVYAQGSTFIAAYANSGDLYLITSMDGGQTWSNPERINDEDGTVVEEENNIDVHAGGIVWVDERNGPYHVYFTMLSIPTDPIITGPANGDPNTEYTFKFTATDPSGGNVYFFIEWGDGTDSGWLGPFGSGVETSVEHTYTSEAVFTIRAKAKNDLGFESGWSTFKFSTPRNKALLLNFIENFPNIMSILKYFFGF